MTAELGCSYSTISANELMEKVIPEYGIDSPSECLFWERGSTDTYKVRCQDATYFLRVFRCGAYPRDANEFEAEALNYMHQQGFSVAYPIARKSGGYITEIKAPEGPRFVLVTAAVEGSQPDFSSLDTCRLVGESVARMHEASNGFETTLQRTHLDLQWLVDDSLVVIRQHMAHHTDALRLIETVAQDIRVAVQAVPEESLDYGICHGDMHGGNLHLHEGRVTHFDFEECAFGYRLYDLGTFKWDVCVGPDKERAKRWLAFMEGYSSIRQLPEAELALVDTFVLVRELAELAYGIRHINDFGHNDILASNIDRVCERLNQLRTP